MNKLFADTKNASYLSETILTISETGITSKDVFSESKHDWWAFVKTEETREYFYLSLSSFFVITISKRVFSSSSEKAEFENYLSKYISVEADFAGK